MFYVIRHKESGKLMPEYKTGKGYSFWLADDNTSNQKSTPRLLASKKEAEKVIIEWAKGTFIWEEFGEGWHRDARRVMKDLGRNKNELEVVSVLLVVAGAVL